VGTLPESGEDEQGGEDDEGVDPPESDLGGGGICDTPAQHVHYDFGGSLVPDACGERVNFEGRIIGRDPDALIVDACPCDSDCGDLDPQELTLDGGGVGWPNTPEFELGACVQVEATRPGCEQRSLRVEVETESACKLGLLHAALHRDINTRFLEFYDSEDIRLWKSNEAVECWPDEGVLLLSEGRGMFYGADIYFKEMGDYGGPCPLDETMNPEATTYTYETRNFRNLHLGSSVFYELEVTVSLGE
jgi:hypothetical protein